MGIDAMTESDGNAVSTNAERDWLIEQLCVILRPLSPDLRAAILATVEERLADVPNIGPKTDPLLEALYAWGKFSTRTYNCLCDVLSNRPETRGMPADERRLSMVAGFTAKDLLKSFNFGRVSLGEVEQALHEHGWRLRISAPLKLRTANDTDAVTLAAKLAAQEAHRTQARETDCEMYRLKIEEKRTYRQIAEQFGISPERAKLRIQREARRRSDQERFPLSSLRDKSGAT